MAETNKNENVYDNTRPAQAGSISLSRTGMLCYFPIELASGARPFQALIIHEKASGDTVMMIDYRYPPSALLGPLED